PPPTDVASTTPAAPDPSQETTPADQDAATAEGSNPVEDGFHSAPGLGQDPAEETSQAPSQEPTEPQEVTIGAAGDILPHAPVLANAQANAGGTGYDFSPMFADVSDLLSQPDLTICHMETPLSADNTDLTVPRVLVFNSPFQVVDALVGAGFDGCDFASNHTWDRGLSGLAETEQVIRE